MDTEPRLVTSYSQTESIPEGEYFVFSKGFQDCFVDEYATNQPKPYLICRKTGKESHRFLIVQTRSTSAEARQCVEELRRGS